jgi:hypothetical protein
MGNACKVIMDTMKGLILLLDFGKCSATYSYSELFFLKFF